MNETGQPRDKRRTPLPPANCAFFMQRKFIYKNQLVTDDFNICVPTISRLATLGKRGRLVWKKYCQGLTWREKAGFSDFRDSDKEPGAMPG
ncbi:hypothetical protein PVT68_01100 [Microbulbifer bruguierae]|uniref:Transposase n=1 Tax=Microbulbifer bruguierae TaxID=3029061 RepID=A0ABY8NDB5_9GAMM|nr:hypothetical protein [Microbulbifer bruguierae]WGL16911.1 hypothetical protein PVT68_01100 [Microbulbifer bruguierae]